MQWVGYGVMAAGGGAAYASGGLDGLAYYAAGMLGAMAGAYGTSYVAKNWNRWFATELSPQKAGQQVTDGLVVSQSETTITEALNERWSRYGMQVENIRRYTILDWPGPETPFAIYHFKQEFLAQVKILQQTDLLYANHWAKLHKDYSFLRATIDYYRFDVDEAIEHYRSSFGKK